MNPHGAKWLRREKRLAIYIRDGFRCIYCGRSLLRCKQRNVTLDHIVPREVGGTNESINLVVACRECNDRKGNSDWRTFAGPMATLRIMAAITKPLDIASAKQVLAYYRGDYLSAFLYLRKEILEAKRREQMRAMQRVATTS